MKTVLSVFLVLAVLGVAAWVSFPGVFSGIPTVPAQPTAVPVQVQPTAGPIQVQPTAGPAQVQPTTVPVQVLPSAPSTYTVAAGDNSYSIAQKLGITVEELKKANPSILDWNVIYTGQVLQLPVSSVQAQPTAVPVQAAPTTAPVNFGRGNMPAAVDIATGCALLGEDPDFVGTVCFPRMFEKPAYTIPVYEGGFTIIALGNGAINGVKFQTDDWGTIGNLVTIPGKLDDGTTPRDLNSMKFVLDAGTYIPGAVGVTSLWAPEDMLKAADKAAENMVSNAPNCGANACNLVKIWMFDWNTKTFTLLKEVRK